MLRPGVHFLIATTLVNLFIVGSIVIGEPKYEKLLSNAKEHYEEQGYSTIVEWTNMLETLQGKSETNQLRFVNDFFNQKVQFSTDHKIWGTKDYWATPLETMGLMQGDCEDFSIAKYMTLLQLGMPVNKLRLIYVKATLNNNTRQAHMVLAYYEKAHSEPLILDNISKEILPASKRVDLFPIFSFNSEGLWVGNAAEPKVKKPETRLSRWQDVLLRMQSEGFK